MAMPNSRTRGRIHFERAWPRSLAAFILAIPGGLSLGALAGILRIWAARPAQWAFLSPSGLGDWLAFIFLLGLLCIFPVFFCIEEARLFLAALCARRGQSLEIRLLSRQDAFSLSLRGRSRPAWRMEWEWDHPSPSPRGRRNTYHSMQLFEKDRKESVFLAESESITVFYYPCLPSWVFIPSGADGMMRPWLWKSVLVSLATFILIASLVFFLS